ncbi:hypothetical protein N0V86_005858 [Didymella sp. IMI 355093]|nr:hypothetical protein N0V86_005858 [Didymella sp. IMI 355093]
MDTHESLSKVGREFWVTGEGVDRNTVNIHGATQAVLQRAQKKSPKSKPTGTPKIKTSTAGDAHPKNDSASKRAALIAKSKAAKDSTLVVSKSANQRRSAMQRNKNQRITMPLPPPTTRKAGPAEKQGAQTESRPTVLIVDREEKAQRRELDSALQSGALDLSNDRHMELLMKRLRSTGADTDEDEGRSIEVEVS